MTIPIPCRWTGDSWVPINAHWAKQADADFVIGEIYPMAPVQERSQASHNHYFASVHDAWSNLGDDANERWPSAEHLRKWALIRAGYRDERTIVCASKAEAQRVAAFMKPLDDYAVIVAKDNIVVAWTAKSQSVKAMGKADFQASKDAVLQIVAELVGAQPAQLGRAA